MGINNVKHLLYNEKASVTLMWGEECHLRGGEGRGKEGSEGEGKESAGY